MRSLLRLLPLVLAPFVGAQTSLPHNQQGAKLDEHTHQGLTVLDYAMCRIITTQLPVPHDSTVAMVRKLGGQEGRNLPPVARA